MEIPISSSSKANKEILVILKNPSKATMKKSDYTINRVLKFCYKWQYSKVYIMNLFPYYSTAAKGVNKFIKNKTIYYTAMENNIEMLKHVAKNIDDVIVAWGSNTIKCGRLYGKVAKRVESELNNKNVYCVGGKTKYNYPLHAQRWKDNMKKQKYI